MVTVFWYYTNSYWNVRNEVLKMRKLKLIKVVIPELVAIVNHEGKIYHDYACECGFGIGKGDCYCRACGSELNWKKVKMDGHEYNVVMRYVNENR